MKKQKNNNPWIPGEGEICTLDTMGPVWIHINKAKNISAEQDYQRFERWESWYKQAHKKKVQDTDTNLYRVIDLTTNECIFPWAPLAEYYEFMHEELLIDTDRRHPVKLREDGSVFNYRYMIEVQKGASANEKHRKNT